MITKIDRSARSDSREILPMNTIMTREQAIAALVERDVAKWGEAERAASERLRGRLSHGRALNSLAHYDVDNIDHELAQAAKSVMTDDDERALRQGG